MSVLQLKEPCKNINLVWK